MPYAVYYMAYGIQLLIVFSFANILISGISFLAAKTYRILIQLKKFKSFEIICSYRFQLQHKHCSCRLPNK